VIWSQATNRAMMTFPTRLLLFGFYLAIALVLLAMVLSSVLSG
jgi:hypothetical protein